MKKFAFILGNNPILSISEILRLAQNQKLEFNIVDIISDCFIIETQNIDTRHWQSMLGGTVKIGEIISSFKKQHEVFDYLNKNNLLTKFFAQKNKKIIFGISEYGVSFNKKEKIKQLAISTKKELQNDGYSCRYIQAEKKNLSSVQVDKNKLITNGSEILLIGGIYGFYVGKTLNVQDFEEYSHRDYGRPGRDAKSGMLPPKLAKIMINLSQAAPNNKILDPFCGSGTILQESILLGYKKIIGSDISAKAVNDSQQNTEWLINEKNIKDAEIKIFKSDIKKLNELIEPNSIDNIITEPYLGPPEKYKSVSDIFPAIEELEDLYLDTFKIFDKICSTEAIIVIVFPLIKYENDVFVLKILEKIYELGWQRISPIPEKISLFAKIGPTARGSLIYQRPEQRISREIFIFRRQKN